MRSPDISVVMATYNHAPFVREAIGSVLQQSEVNLELLVADDGSSDATREVVGGISDDRMSFFPSTVNRGAGVVTNELISRSKAKYVALINSDDYWVPGKLSYQFRFLEENPDVGATFGRANFVDSAGNAVPRESMPLGTGSIFDQENRPAGRWLRRFFAEGNCLCHPTMLIRREVYENLGLYSNRLRQLPDLDMWIRLVKRFNIHVSQRELINFRMLPGENASSHTAENHVRTLNEHYLIGETAFDGVSRDRMIEGFEDILVFKDIPSDEHLEIEKALMYFHHNQWLWRPYKLIGLSYMRRLLTSEAHRAVLEHQYGINDRWFQGEMSKVDVFVPPVACTDSIRHHAQGLWRAGLRRLTNPFNNPQPIKEKKT